MTLDEFLKNLSPKEQSLFHKLWELTKRGIGGEKENAEWFIKQFCAKRGAEWGDLEIEEKIERTFSGIRLTQLFCNIVSKVQNTYDIKVWTKRKNPTEKIVLCTPVEFAEIQLMYEIYSKAYYDEVRKLKIAFVHKHNLFPAALPKKEAKEEIEDELGFHVLTDKEIRDLKKKKKQEMKSRKDMFDIANMMSGLSDVQVQRRITENSDSNE